MRECNFPAANISGIEQKKRGHLMFGKIVMTAAAATAISFTAAANPADSSDAPGEALAWTVAAYASCETPQLLQSDFKEEATKLDSSMGDVVAALEILEDADNVCGNLNLFAADMLALAETDMATLEARLGAESAEPTPVVFQIEEPEGAGAQNSIILTNSADLPPLSGSSNPPSSDYQ